MAIVTVTKSASPGVAIPTTGTGPGYVIPNPTLYFTEEFGSIVTLSASLNITHPYQGDLWIKLFAPAPDGNFVYLWQGTGGGTDNIIQTFDVSAWALGKSINGAWYLQIYDDQTGDSGVLNSWTLEATYSYEAVSNQPMIWVCM